LSALFVVLLVGEMAFSTFCQFLEFCFQGSDNESKTVSKVFICHTDAKLLLHEVQIWKRRPTAI